MSLAIGYFRACASREMSVSASATEELVEDLANKVVRFLERFSGTSGEKTRTPENTEKREAIVLV